MGLATEAAGAIGCPLPMGGAAEKVYAQIIVEEPDFSRKDFSSVYQYLRLASNN